MSRELPVPEGTHVLSNKNRITSIISACAGNLVEWYDFFIYAYTAIYFASLFFPDGNQTTQLMASAGIFAVGFFMRPIGGWIFGYIADNKGRKVAMVLSVFLMCGGSLLIAVMPVYSSIGVAAPALLLVARLMQGLSVGAEYGTGATYISEISRKGTRCFFGSFQYMTIIAGQLLALLTISLLQLLLTAEQMHAWGWRIPFLIGAFSALAVVYVRRHMAETLVAKKSAHTKAGTLRELMKYPRAITVTLFITMGCSLYFYTFTSYMQKYLVLSVGMSPESAGLIMTSALVLFMVVQPLFGALADRIGSRTSMIIFGVLATLFVIPLMTLLRGTTDVWSALLLVAAGLLIASFYTPITGVLKADLFPAGIRALGVSLPYAVGNALCGGTAEYVALWTRSQGIESNYFIYVAVMTCLSLIAALLLPNLQKHGWLDGDGKVEDLTQIRSRKPALISDSQN
ncbi:MFS transporter [Pluralibacter gergoviae]|uniref:MFS transporter n=1 Tax=Pluralibacter gergoviae TaxID=61647 RepID=UPI0006514F51|nr:MFS transporter [Pluralibacter gergoviae]ELC3073900.1 MFS transporter [Pluralibacter gergoviae]KMK09966.1 alpha-ketoglutarate permease [Pluralibacter gergoviae]